MSTINNNTKIISSCRSCGSHFTQTSKTIKNAWNETVVIEEEFCSGCLSKYVKNVDFLDSNNYAHQNSSQGLTPAKKFMV